MKRRILIGVDINGTSIDVHLGPKILREQVRRFNINAMAVQLAS